VDLEHTGGPGNGKKLTGKIGVRGKEKGLYGNSNFVSADKRIGGQLIYIKV